MRRFAKLLVAAILSGALGAMAPAALGQPVAPSAAPSAKPKAAPSAAPSAGPKAAPSAAPSAGPKAAPAADAGAAPPSSGGLPAGHPPVDQGLPAGHPPVGSGNDDDDDDEAPPNPHGGGQARPPGLFQPPPDTAQEDPALPVGSLVVSIRDAQDKPIPRARLTLGLIRSSVAKGESSEVRPAEANEEGNARFDGLPTGSEVHYRITTSRGAAVYSLEAGSLNDRGAGKRAVLHSYDVTSNIDALTLGINALVILSLREDSIRIEQLLVVGNPSPVAWVADAPFTLPAGFKAFNKQQGNSEARVDEVKDRGAALRGTFAPGRHNVNFVYQVPLTKDPTQTLKLELPPHVMAVRVAAELGKTMGLQVRGLPAAQPLRNEGKKFLVTEWQMKRAEDGLSNLEITLTGLPTQGWGRVFALVLAILALIIGIIYSAEKSGTVALDPDARNDLLEAREALLSEIVALERAHKSGEVGPRTYARLRAALLDALARIVTMLDAGKAEQKRRRRAARAAESST